MAVRTKKNDPRALLIGAGAAALTLVLLLIVALSGGLLQQAYHSTFRSSAQVLTPNPYGPEDFAYDAQGYLTCTAGPSTLGIDVSAHQKDIDWQAVAEAGVEFVMIRAGYRGYETGYLNVDAYAQANYKGAKAAGLQVGAYFFSQATSVEEALEEAEFFLEIIDGWALDLPVVLDWEYAGEDRRTALADKATVTECLLAFDKRMKQEGLESMVYFNPHHARNYIDIQALQACPFWLAMYSDEMDYEYRVDIWQYTNQGSVPGIKGNVDINLWLK